MKACKIKGTEGKIKTSSNFAVNTFKYMSKNEIYSSFHTPRSLTTKTAD